MADDPPGASDEERRAMATLARAVEAAAGRRWWTRLRYRLLFLAWKAGVLVAAGVGTAAAGLGIIWAEMSTDIEAALGGELVLAAGGLVTGLGVRRWYRHRQRQR